MSGVVSDWTKKRAREEYRKAAGPCLPKPSYDDLGFWENAFARYIAEHEDEPVDSVMFEARKICADWYEEKGCPNAARDHRAGEYDDGDDLQQVALAGLKRGIELAKTGGDA